MPSVKIGAYAKRKPKNYFYIDGQVPIAPDSENHGGFYYDQSYDVKSRKSHSLPFERNVPDMKKMIKHINEVTKKSK